MKNKIKNPGEEKTITIDMPEVKDIPGQEHIKPPRIKEMEDVTISSADEEGEGLLDDLNQEEGNEAGTDNKTIISAEEKKSLRRSLRPVTSETEDLEKLVLDSVDDDGDELNETGKPGDMGEDLDVPGAELDDDDEAYGNEDEENNSYSQRD